MTSPSRTRRPVDLQEAVAILERTPAALDAMLRGLPEGWIQAHEGGETWSPFDVIGHLIHGEQTDWLARVRIILEHGEARPFDKFDRLAQFAESPGRTLDALLDEFASLRRANLRDLAALQLGRPTSRVPARTRRSAASRSASCWRRGWRTTWITSSRSRGSSPGNTATRSAPGGPTCASSAASRADRGRGRAGRGRRP